MNKTTRIMTALLILGLVVSTGYLAYRYKQLHAQKAQLIQQLDTSNQQLQTYRADPSIASKIDGQKYLTDVEKLYTLPKDEQPIIGTVDDVEKLPKDPPFFANAVKGDVTLIYAKAKLGILYRPSTNKLINVSSVTIEDQAQPPTAAPTAPQE